MREILFRGRNDYGKWVEGFYIKDIILTYIYNKHKNPHMQIVITETVGQYTGLQDKNGTKIFDGDIVKHYNHNPIKEYSEDIGRVFYYSETCRFLRTSKLFPDECPEIKGCCEYEVIGNIHDNPDLLEVQK